MGIFLSLTLDEWIFAIGGLVFILLGKLLVQSLAPKQTGALGFVNAMKELPRYTKKGGTLYVFSLP